MIIFEQLVLPAVVVLGTCAAIVYALYTDRKEAAIKVRAKTLREAAAALQSLADVAGDAVEARRRAGEPWNVTADRAYHYQRAAQIVASIPIDRL